MIFIDIYLYFIIILNMTTENMLISRIKEIIDYKGVSSRAFAQKIDFSYSVLNNYLLGKRNTIDAELPYKIISTYNDINAEWLIAGTGRMIKDKTEISNVNKVEQPTYSYAESESHTPLVQALINERRRYDENTAELLNQNRDLINQNRELTEIIRRQTELLGRPSTARTNIAGCADAG